MPVCQVWRQYFNFNFMSQFMSKTHNLQLVLSQKDDDWAEAESAGDLAVQERQQADISPPSRYQVIILNDDFTPMEFVVEVLENFFHMSREQATQVMLTIHHQGKAVCGIFSRDIAETKAFQVVQYARENQHPLLCKIEKAAE